MYSCYISYLKMTSRTSYWAVLEQIWVKTHFGSQIAPNQFLRSVFDRWSVVGYTFISKHLFSQKMDKEQSRSKNEFYSKLLPNYSVTKNLIAYHKLLIYRDLLWKFEVKRLKNEQMRVKWNFDLQKCYMPKKHVLIWIQLCFESRD